MATFNVVGLDEAIKQIDLEAERIKKRAPAAVQAGAEAAQKALAASAPYRNGDLSGSIKIGEIKNTVEDGIHCDVYPHGKNRNGERNATVGFVLEYGRSNMPARPWMRTTMERESNAITDAILGGLMSD